MKTLTRRRIIVDDSALATRIGGRLREARKQARLTQQQLAEGRYTKAYISALEKGHAKPSMAALNFLSQRLGLPPSHFLGDPTARWDRLDADILLASGRWQAAADAFEAILAQPLDRSLRAEALHGRAEALCRLDRGAEAIAAATESLETFHAIGRDRDAALVTYWLAYGQHLVENTAEAAALLSGLLAQLRMREDLDPDLRVRVLIALSSLEATEDHHRSALGYLEEARVMAADLDDWRRAAFLSQLAYNYTGTGDVEAAIRTGVESLGLFRAAEAGREAAVLENYLALAYLRIGNVERATGFASHARSRHTEDGDRRALAHVADTEAQIALAGGDTAAALRLSEEALGHAHASENHRAVVSSLLTRARSHVADGDPGSALHIYGQAADEIRKHGPRSRLKEALGEWAEVLASQGRHDMAYALTREALLAASDPAPRAEPAESSAPTIPAAASRS
ncbi:MAG: helix-turn-helix domain-containing protein [Chloroflexota bacterium]|nr:helix-turn-helix domain-containing protein [Chloroflexota bacterium]